MCNLYRMTASVDEMKALFGPFDGDRANLPAQAEIYPKYEAPILRRELRRVRDERDALLVVELLAVGVDLPALRRGVGLLEQPARGPRELHRAHGAAHGLVVALERVREAGLVGHEEAVAEGQADALGLQQESAQLRQAIKTLPEDQKNLIVQAYFGDLSHSQIAAATGLPLGTIKSRIRLALDRLRHVMKR